MLRQPIIMLFPKNTMRCSSKRCFGEYLFPSRGSRRLFRLLGSEASFQPVIAQPSALEEMKVLQNNQLNDFANVHGHLLKAIDYSKRVPRSTRPVNAKIFNNQILKHIDTFIFDADGVLWLGDAAIPGSSNFVESLIKCGKRVIVLTNNATKSRAEYSKKLANLGFSETLNKNSLVNPAAVVADLLHQSGMADNGKKVYLIGAKGVRDELDELNIQYFGHEQEPLDNTDGSTFQFELDLEEHPDDVGAVVVGYNKHFNYQKLMKAANYLQNDDCMFVATNEDETCPGPNPDVVIPDAGPIVAAVKCASGRDPITVGKPNAPSFEYICRRWDINPTRTMMIGDRTNTDVKFGRDHGLKTMMVLSGCHQVDDIAENQLSGRDDMVPDFYATCLGDLCLKNESVYY